MLTDKHRESGDVKPAVLSLQRKRCVTCFLPRSLGTDMINSLATQFTQILTFIYSTNPPWNPYHEHCLPQACFLSKSIEPIFMEDVTWTWSEIQYNHVLSFCYAYMIKLIISRKFFPNCALLNMPEANYLMSGSKFETTLVTESYWTQPTSCLSWINTLLTMVFAAIPHTSLIFYNDPCHVGRWSALQMFYWGLSIALHTFFFSPPCPVVFHVNYWSHDKSLVVTLLLCHFGRVIKSHLCSGVWPM